MRPLAGIVLIVGMMAPAATADFVVNGGFEEGTMNGWAQWGPIGWGSGDVTVNTQAAGIHSGAYGARIRPTPNGSLGLKQVVAVPANEELTLSCWVKSAASTFNWAEVLLYPFAVTNDATQIDSGAGSGPYIIWKRDSWGGINGIPGGSLPTPNSDWEQVTGTVTSASGFVTIAFKFGQDNQSTNANMRVDDVSLVPEPASLSLLLLGGAWMTIRRRVR